MTRVYGLLTMLTLLLYGRASECRDSRRARLHALHGALCTADGGRWTVDGGWMGVPCETAQWHGTAPRHTRYTQQGRVILGGLD